MDNDPSLTRRWPALRVAQWAAVAVLVAVSELVAWTGHHGASYGVDGMALLAYLGFRYLRRPHSPRP